MSTENKKFLQNIFGSICFFIAGVIFGFTAYVVGESSTIALVCFVLGIVGGIASLTISVIARFGKEKNVF